MPAPSQRLVTQEQVVLLEEQLNACHETISAQQGRLECIEILMQNHLQHHRMQDQLKETERRFQEFNDSIKAGEDSNTHVYTYKIKNLEDRVTAVEKSQKCAEVQDSGFSLPQAEAIDISSKDTHRIVSIVEDVKRSMQFVLDERAKCNYVQHDQIQTLIQAEVDAKIAAVEANEKDELEIDGREQSLENEIEMDSETLEHTVWDYALLIGVPDMGLSSSVVVAMLVCANIALQLTLSLIINDVFTVATITPADSASMRYWRLHYGHWLGMMSKFTSQPFVKDLCSFDSSLYMSTPGAGILSEIEEYFPRQDMLDSYAEPFLGRMLPYIEEIGIVMCSFAVFIWLMFLVNHLSGIVAKTQAFFHLPQSEATRIVQDSDSNTLVSVTRARQVWYAIVLLFQVIVDVILGFAGLFYIIRTISLRDLLLNCSALALVLDLDEQMATFIPNSTRRLLLSLGPLPFPVSHKQEFPVTSIIKITFVSAVLSYAVWELNSQGQVLIDTRDELCGGNLDFITAVDAAGILNVAQAPPVDHKSGGYFDMAMSQLVRDPIDFGGPVALDSPFQFVSAIDTGAFSLETWTSAGIDEVIDAYNPVCEDMLPAEDSTLRAAIHFRTILREAIGNPSFTQCSEVAEFCFRDTIQGTRMRQVCPATCGCNDPSSPMVFYQKMGCPPACKLSSIYTQFLSSRECTDLEATSPYFVNYAHGVERWLGEHGIQMLDLAYRLRSEGCNLTTYTVPFVGGVVWEDSCRGSREAQLKPLSFACPVSCGCKKRRLEDCPNSC